MFNHEQRPVEAQSSESVTLGVEFQCLRAMISQSVSELTTAMITDNNCAIRVIDPSSFEVP
jgi:hypothetical protein